MRNELNRLRDHVAAYAPVYDSVYRHEDNVSAAVAALDAVIALEGADAAMDGSVAQKTHELEMVWGQRMAAASSSRVCRAVWHAMRVAQITMRVEWIPTYTEHGRYVGKKCIRSTTGEVLIKSFTAECLIT